MDETSSNGHDSNGQSNGKANGRVHHWDFKLGDRTEGNTQPIPKQEGIPVPGNEDLVITSRGNVVEKYKLDNLKRGGIDEHKRNMDPNKKQMPDLREALIRVLSDERNGKVAIDSILEGVRFRAVKGDPRAADLILTRAYGAAVMNLDENFLPVEPLTGFIIKRKDDPGPMAE